MSRFQFLSALRRSHSIVTLAAFGAGSVLCGETPAAATRPLAPQTVGELTDAIAQVAKENGVPGVGLALLSKGELVFVGGIGKADIEADRPVSAETLFRVGSVSKSAVAVALLRLQEAGKVDLQARLADVVPELAIANRYEQQIPLRVIHLLEHTAGFDDTRFNDLVASGSEKNPPLRAALSVHPGSREARWAPGTRASYSSPGYAVAGFVIEKVAGVPFEDFVRTSVFGPIGMAASTFRPLEAGQEDIARGYLDRRLTRAPVLDVHLRPAGSMVSSPRDMGLLVQLLLNRGTANGRQVLRPESIAAMETVRTTLAARAGLVNGYGLGNDVDLQFPITLRGHDGGLPGFSTQFRYSAEHGFGYALLFNTTAAYAARQRIHRLVYEFLSRDASPHPPGSVTLAERDLAPHTGYYALANPKDRLFAFRDALLSGVHVTLQKGRLAIQGLGKPPEELTPLSTRLFRKQHEPDASIVFTTDAAGRMVMVAYSGWSYYEKTAAWKAHLHRGFVFGAIGVMLSAVLFAMVWIPRALLRRKLTWRQATPRLVTLLAVLLFLVFVRLFTALGLLVLGTVNPATVSMFLANISFAVCSVSGLLLAVRDWSAPGGRAAKAHTLAVALAGCGMVLYLAGWGLLGLRSWAW